MLHKTVDRFACKLNTVEVLRGQPNKLVFIQILVVINERTDLDFSIVIPLTLLLSDYEWQKTWA